MKGLALSLVLKVRVFGTRSLGYGLFDWILDEVNYSHTLEKKTSFAILIGHTIFFITCKNIIRSSD